MLSVEQLERWVLFGAKWRLAERQQDRVVVDLLTCTGELEERVVSEDPEVIRYVVERGGASLVE